MHTSQTEVPVIVSQALPLAQEAALLYAHGRTKDAADRLERAIAPGQTDEHNPDAWNMLFDLHRAEADWRSFEQLAVRYEAVLGLAAPEWLAQDETAHLPPEMQQGGAAYFEVVGALDKDAAGRLDAMRKRAGNLSALHLDLSKASEIEAEGCLRLSQTLRFLAANGNGVVVTGGDRLMHRLRKAAEGNPSEAAYWFLLLDLYQLRGMHTDFLRAALEYALASGEPTPEWQPEVRSVIARGVDEKRDEPRYRPVPDGINLTGVMTGAADPQLQELERFALEREYVNVNLSRVVRMDFACATSFSTLVTTLAANGKTVRLIRPNALLGGLLTSFNLAPEVSLLKDRT